jgi:iron complex outermembrane receptor protein
MNLQDVIKVTAKKIIIKALSGMALSPIFLFLFISVSWAENLSEEDEIDYLKQLSIENLLKIEVSSVSKKPEKLSDASAAIFVITAEDIRRSGVTSIPEALRMVPGIQMARIDANKWAVTARGFNNRYANKLLV